MITDVIQDSFIETGYSARDDGVKPEVRVAGLHGSFQRQSPLPPHATVWASHPGHAPPGAVGGHLEDAPGEPGALSMVQQVALEPLEKVADRRPAKPRIRRHPKALA